MATWEEWVQDVGGSILNKAADAKFVQPFEISKLKLEALGEEGYYTEGQRGTSTQPKSGLGGIPPTLLLLGGAVLLVVMLKD